MNDFNLTDVVKNLLIINVLVFAAFLTAFSGYFDDCGLYYVEDERFRPFQLATHFFMHDTSNFFHIAFNMYALATFGPMIEMVWKPKRFLFFYMFCGLFAALFQTFIYYIQTHYFDMPMPMFMTVGASGAVFGLMTAYALLYPRHRMGMLFIPILIEARYAILLFAALEVWQGFGGYQTGIAHFAHLGGIIGAIVLVYYWRFFGSRL